MSQKDYKEAIDFLIQNDVKYIEMSYNPLEIVQFKENRKDRCYYCKKSLMTNIINIARENEFRNILDGKNTDDLKTYRPGNKALEELEILSILAELGFSKSDIRNCSKKLGIEFWNKPSNSCLATRFPYNTILTKQDLQKVEKSEEIIKKLGIQRVRIRAHGNLARIEIEKEDFMKILENKTIMLQMKKLGFSFVTLDLEGIKNGSFD